MWKAVTFLMLALRAASTFAQGHCSLFNTLAMCENSDICPEGYHTCDQGDLNQMYQSDIKNILFDGEYSTNIAEWDGEKTSCMRTPHALRLSIDGTRQHNELSYGSDVRADEEGCPMNQHIVPNGMSYRVTECYTCICRKDAVQCANTCEYKNIYLLQSTPQYRGSEHTERPFVQTMMRCDDPRSISNALACCADQPCQKEGCAICEQYGENEECKACKQGYYFYKDYTSKCFSEDAVLYVCPDGVLIDEEKQSFSCIECVNGKAKSALYLEEISSYDYHDSYEDNDIVSMNELSGCVCNEGWKGDDCSVSNDVIRCSGQGKYSASEERCVCNDGFSGDVCSEPIFYTSNTTCVNGVRLQDICLCHEGFSGTSCDILQREGTIEASIKEKQIQDYLREYRCIYGSFNETSGACECYSGYEGHVCEIPRCKYGVWNATIRECDCNEDYFGEACELSCREPCSYQGSICNVRHTCDCDPQWSGHRCIQSSFTLHRNQMKRVYMNKKEVFHVNTNATSTPIISFTMISETTENGIPYSIRVRSSNDSTSRSHSTTHQSHTQSDGYAKVSIEWTEPRDVNHYEYWIYPDNNRTLRYKSDNINEEWDLYPDAHSALKTQTHDTSMTGENYTHNYSSPHGYDVTYYIYRIPVEEAPIADVDTNVTIYHNTTQEHNTTSTNTTDDNTNEDIEWDNVSQNLTYGDNENDINDSEQISGNAQTASERDTNDYLSNSNIASFGTGIGCIAFIFAVVYAKKSVSKRKLTRKDYMMECKGTNYIMDTSLRSNPSHKKKKRKKREKHQSLINALTKAKDKDFANYNKQRIKRKSTEKRLNKTCINVTRVDNRLYDVDNLKIQYSNNILLARKKTTEPNRKQNR